MNFNSQRFSRVRRLAGAALLVLAAGGPVTGQDPSGPLEAEFRQTIGPLLQKFCSECHQGPEAEGDFALDRFRTTTEIAESPTSWMRARQMLEREEMPPSDAAQPSEAQRQQMHGWVRRFLIRQASDRAGDPGPVVLRRLSNAEYNYAIRDLTGIDTLDPTAEFPVDGASGEGFTNSGSGQGMSPALVQKYLDAGKQVARHAVLLPQGIGFSAFTTRRDQTDELLARIQAFYRRFTEDGGGTPVDLQGIRFDTNQGGLLPLEKYLEALLAERQPLEQGGKTLERVAREHDLNSKYLRILWERLGGQTQGAASFLVDRLRARWNQQPPPSARELADEIRPLQDALWKFNAVGHIGREGGPPSWMERVSPIITRQELRLALPKVPAGSEVTVYLHADDLGDGNQEDVVVWQRPRIEFRPEDGKTRSAIPLANLKSLTQRTRQQIASEAPRTSLYLAAVAEFHAGGRPLVELAKAHQLNPHLLARWQALAGLGQAARREIEGRFDQQLTRIAGLDALNGWGQAATPSLMTNRSAETLRVHTLTIPPRSVTVHPSPKMEAVVAWQSPLAGEVRLAGLVADADNHCGNGAAWRLELRSQSGTVVLEQGEIENGRDQRFQVDTPLKLDAGDVVSLVVNSRAEEHTCDTTQVELKIIEEQGGERTWDLTTDVVDKVLEANPLGDRYGNPHVWHFCAVPSATSAEPKIPPGSDLDQWRKAITAAAPAEEIERLAARVGELLASSPEKDLSQPNQQLRERLLAWQGPLDWMALPAPAGAPGEEGASPIGLAASEFGHHPRGLGVADEDLCLQAPHAIAIRLPGELTSGAELVTEGILHPESSDDGSVQLRMDLSAEAASPLPSDARVLVAAESRARPRLEAAVAEFQDLFPPALCYSRLVPVDEVVTLTLFYREDEHLRRLMLDERQERELDRLWDALRYVSQEPLQMVVAYEQIAEFATQDAPELVKALAPMKAPIDQRASDFKERMRRSEPSHVDALIDLASIAWRRPLADGERENLRGLYQRLRQEDLPHDGAIRLLIARVLSSPTFLYKLEQPGPGPEPMPISDLELASRLSFFLWSSLPDEPLRREALEGKLSRDDVLLDQLDRMRGDPKIRRLAIHFACQWLHVRDFDRNDDKNENLYPEFAELRKEMYEETVLFFEDLFRNDRSILDLLDCDATFLNEALARHYGIEGVEGAHWRRVEGVRERGRGGVLGMASVLASQSGASRTSPILRGNWVYETLLGERLPRPPADVPQLPEELPQGLTSREMIEQHSSVAACARCHVKIDPFGFALEQYDAIGRLRPEPVDTATALADGTEFAGRAGLVSYLKTQRQEDVVRQFCRKLLGYSLGRELLLSDEPLLDKIMGRLAENDYRVSVALEEMVASRQFREIRGRADNDPPER